MTHVIRPGRSITFPVEHTHPLAGAQTLRTPTLADISAHPIYSRILEDRVAEALSAYPVAERTPTLEAQIRERIAHIIILNIGSIIRYGLQDISVVEGQTLTFQSSWSEVYAGDVRIAPGGVIRVTVANPALPAFFLLNCNSLGSM